MLREKVSERREGGEGGEAGDLFIGYNPTNKLFNLIVINQKMPKNKQTYKQTKEKNNINNRRLWYTKSVSFINGSQSSSTVYRTKRLTSQNNESTIYRSPLLQPYYLLVTCKSNPFFFC